MQTTPRPASAAPEKKPVSPSHRAMPSPANPVRAPESKDGDPRLSRLDFDFEVKLVGSEDDASVGRIEGYASVFGILDKGGDIVQPGAFKKTLAEWKKKGQLIPMLWQHDPHTPIGVWTDLVEDDHGLKVGGDLIMDVPQAAIVRALVKAKAVRGLSIGYASKDATIDRATGARLLKTVDLWEISPVTFPMLPEATISGVKTFDPNTLERALRDEAGLSHREAKAAISVFRQHLRDGGKPDDATRDGKADVLMSLRKAASVFSA